MKAFSINGKVSNYLSKVIYHRAAFAKSLDFKEERHFLQEDARFVVAKGVIQLTSVATSAMKSRIIYKKKVS